MHTPARSIVLGQCAHSTQYAHDACPTVKLSLTRLYQRKHAALEALKKSLLHIAFNGEQRNDIQSLKEPRLVAGYSQNHC